ncbi:uncharacterized protein LOC126565071 [Anopheles maculipalpis]|uniref:uncharacterized protein LOC126565071 n=1 Tax=Anopheles maculipalpis TaxID=1496333 RepID=UPI0021597905|nr:uncharacterized protein LOC126565071 [Anopheles maculipalpis]
MADIEELEEFVSQIAKPERTIKCVPDGIRFEQFATACDLPGAPDETKKALQFPVLKLREITLKDDETATHIATILQHLTGKLPSFVTLEQYAWLARTTVAAQLLKELPTKVANLVRKLSIGVEGIELADHSPPVVHVVAKSLIEDIPLTGGNLLHVIKTLAIANCPLLYYTGVALVFAGLDTIVQLDCKAPELYCVQGVNEFLRRLEIFNLQYLQQQSNNLQTIYQLLKLLSLYQNMVIMRHVGKSLEELSEEHNGYAESLHVTNAQIRTFRQWLDNASAIVQPFGKDQEKDFLILADLLQVDMIPLFDDLSHDEDIV